MAKAINIDGSTVAARDDALFYQALTGKNGIFNYGSKISQTVISSNKIRIKDGMIQVQGRNYVIYPSEVIDITIDNGSQGKKRNDIIVAEFEKTSSKEEFSIKVVKGIETVGTAIDPVLVQQDTLSSGTIYQLPLYRIRIDGINISVVDDLRVYIPSLARTLQVISETDDYLEVDYFK